MSPARPFRDDRVPRRRPVHRIGDLLPAAAAALGLQDQLAWARAGIAWEEAVGALVPAAAGGSRLARLEPDGTLVVEASAPLVGQELRLSGDDLLAGLAAREGGIRAARLRIVVRRGIIP